MNRSCKCLLKYLVWKYGAEKVTRILIKEHLDTHHLRKKPKPKINPDAIIGRACL